ncbi:lyase family protein, partial [Ilumatobacter sp.]|uniref:lyase family protein n=1 Tax=Ilumatobacter sp. TaxID=1967498 RepID=UPI003AF65FDA
MADYLGLGDRLSSGPSDVMAVAAFGDELRAAKYLWRGMSSADLAQAIALHECGVVETPIARELLNALVELDALSHEEVEFDPHVGDLYNNRDRMLKIMAPEAAGYLHSGRARREASTIGWLLGCRTSLLDLGADVCDLVDVLARVSSEHADTLMPDFTYLHRAHPTSLGHYLLSHAWPISRHLDRLRWLIETLAASSPAGSGSTNGTRIPLDRQLLAELLGFESPMLHTRDSMWAPDLAIDMAALCVQITTSVDRLAEEFQLWTTEGFRFIALADEHCRTSVIMPHKKNPYALTHLRGAARRLTGLLVGVTASVQTASGQPDNRTIAYHDVPFMLEITSESVRLMTQVVALATFERSELAAAADDPLMASTEVCDLLTLEFGMDNRTAHRVVGRAVRNSLDHGRSTITAISLERAADELDIGITLDAGHLASVMSPTSIVADRRSLGGAGPASGLSLCRSLAAHAAAGRAWLG